MRKCFWVWSPWSLRSFPALSYGFPATLSQLGFCLGRSLYWLIIWERIRNPRAHHYSLGGQHLKSRHTSSPLRSLGQPIVSEMVVFWSVRKSILLLSWSLFFRLQSSPNRNFFSTWECLEGLWAPGGWLLRFPWGWLASSVAQVRSSG